jgi:transposase
MITHDYKRHATTTLFAAVDVKSGVVIGDCMPRHRAKEFPKFVRQIDKAVPARRDVHLVLDNYASHKKPEVRAWLEKHPRFMLHFTSISASWLNLVERFFAEITAKRIRRGSYSSVDNLEDAIYDYLLQHNARPKPFVWSKTAEDIITRERRALDALDDIRGNRQHASDSEHWKKQKQSFSPYFSYSLGGVSQTKLPRTSVFSFFGEQMPEVERCWSYFKTSALLYAIKWTLWDRGEKTHPIFQS